MQKKLTSFYKKFPKITLPVTLNESVIKEFSKYNLILTDAEIQDFIMPNENLEFTEFTEFIPCFQLADTGSRLKIIVYWRGDLLYHQYTILVIDKSNTVISKKIIAGVFAKDQVLVESIATIDEDWVIHIVSGKNKNNTEYDPKSSSISRFEIQPTGSILPIKIESI